MRWRGRRESDNVVFHRGNSQGAPRRRRAAAGGGGLSLGVIVLALAGWYFGIIDGNTVMSLISGGGQPQMGYETSGYQSGSGSETSQASTEREAFVKVVVADTEDVWTKIFREAGAAYPQPTLNGFRGSIPTACGTGQAAMGPFYCPADQEIYIDLTFFDELASKFGAPGDFAQAYVIAHEVGHHIQTVTGTSKKVHNQKRGLSKAAANQLSVRQELQADCYAGLWAHHAERAKQILERGDIDEALRAANAIGDDTLQRRSSGRIVPDSFTHGSSDQRIKWFKVGFEHGSYDRCDTFKVPENRL